jgi:hypothetical protein
LRADETGQPHILEANPKPDLKQPANGTTSLVSAGLSQIGLDYDDLILSLLADRLDFLFGHRRGTVKHIVDLLDGGESDLAGLDTVPEQQTDTDAMVLSLQTAGRQMRAYNAP